MRLWGREKRRRDGLPRVLGNIYPVVPPSPADEVGADWPFWAHLTELIAVHGQFRGGRLHGSGQRQVSRVCRVPEKELTNIEVRP